MFKKIFVVLLVFIAAINTFAVCGANCDLQKDKEVDPNNNPNRSCDKGDDQKGKESEKQAQAVSGPTLILGYDQSSKANPIFSFMYFVPMISPTQVEMHISDDCTQQGRFVSYDYDLDGDEFTTVTEFEMTGEGYYTNLFDPEKAISWNAEIQDYPGKVKKVLEYIKFKGEGVGRIEISGLIKNGTKQVSDVKVNFDAGDNESPVTIGIYDVKREGGEYKYENAENRIVARIKALTFERTDGKPRMGIEIDSISDSEEKAGFLASLKGAFANLFIKPIVVTKEGNKSMLDFGLAITDRQDSFTFPKAVNLKQNRDSRNSLALNEVKTGQFRTKEKDNF